jgi:hypothetical protein
MTGIFIALVAGTLSTTSADTTGLPPGPFLSTVRITHHPEEILFANRPYDLDLFVAFPRDSVASVSIFIRTDSMEQFQEFPLTGRFGRYTYRYDPERLPGRYIEYFFVVRLKPFALFATPLDEQGRPHPVKRIFVDPVEYFRWKKAHNR